MSKRPALRFKGYKKEWVQQKLGELVEIGDIDHRMPDTVADGIPYLMTGDFCGTNELNFSGVKTISESDYEQLSRKIKPEQGDIIFARYASVGAARFIDFSRRFLISYSCAIIKQSEKVNSKYLYHFITSIPAQKQIRLEVNAGTQANIGIDSMKNNIYVSLPSDGEQIKIADTLSKLDKVIILHQRKYDMLLTYKKAMLEKMFPKDGANVPEVRFAGYTKAWKAHKLSEIATEITRNDPTSNAPIMMITAKDGFIEQSERYAFNNAGKSLKKYTLLKKGELAYNHGASKLRPYGSCFALNNADEARIPFVYHCFSVGDNNSSFLSVQLNGTYIEKQLRRIVSSSARMDGLLNISYDEYVNVQIMMPETEEQNKIAEFFHNLDELISFNAKQVEKLKTLKTALLEKMFI